MKTFDLMVAPNGARLTKADHPELPLTSAELADCAQACWQAGANWFHLHVRDDSGQHSLDTERYLSALAAITTAAPELKIQVTTEAAGIFDVPAQIDCLRTLRPKAASMSVRELARDPKRRAEAYAVATENSTAVQHILYSTDDLDLLLAGYADGTIPKTMRDVIFVLGRYVDGQVSRPTDLDPFLTAKRGHDLRWSVCAFGPNELDCLLYAIQSGGNARIGFENNTLAPDGTPYPDNQTAVATLVAAARTLGYVPAKDQT